MKLSPPPSLESPTLSSQKIMYGRKYAPTIPVGLSNRFTASSLLDCSYLIYFISRNCLVTSPRLQFMPPQAWHVPLLQGLTFRHPVSKLRLSHTCLSCISLHAGYLIKLLHAPHVPLYSWRYSRIFPYFIASCAPYFTLAYW